MRVCGCVCVCGFQCGRNVAVSSAIITDYCAGILRIFHKLVQLTTRPPPLHFSTVFINNVVIWTKIVRIVRRN